MTGLKILGVYDADEFVDIDSGTDHIIVMRCNEAFGSTGYGLSMSYKPREMTDAEMINNAKNEQVKTLSGTLTY